MVLTNPHEKGQEGMVLQDNSGKITTFLEKGEIYCKNAKINAGISFPFIKQIPITPPDRIAYRFDAINLGLKIGLMLKFNRHPFAGKR